MRPAAPPAAASPPPPAVVPSTAALMPEDLAVLEAVRNDGRIRIHQLAERLGIAESTARDRLHRLERDGFIRGYQALVSPEAIGRNVHAVAILDAPPERWEQLCRTIAKDPFVERAHRLIQQPDQVAVCLGADSADSLAKAFEAWEKGLGVRVVEVQLLGGSIPVEPGPAQAHDPGVFSMLKAPF